MILACSVRDELDQQIQQAYEEHAVKKYEGAQSEQEALRRIGHILKQKHAHCLKHGCTREIQSAESGFDDVDALG